MLVPFMRLALPGLPLDNIYLRRYHRRRILIRNTEEAIMRATMHPKTIIRLTNAHRAMVRVMAKGHIVVCVLPVRRWLI